MLPGAYFVEVNDGYTRHPPRLAFKGDPPHSLRQFHVAGSHVVVNLFLSHDRRPLIRVGQFAVLLDVVELALKAGCQAVLRARLLSHDAGGDQRNEGDFKKIHWLCTDTCWAVSLCAAMLGLSNVPVI